MEGVVVDARLSVPWVNDREAVLTSRNKAGVLAALDAAGIPTPRTTLVSNPSTRRSSPRPSRRSLPRRRQAELRHSGRGCRDRDRSRLASGRRRLSQPRPRLPRDRRQVVPDSGVPPRRARLPGDGRRRRVRRRGRAGTPSGRGRGGRWKHNVHRGAAATGVDLPDRARELAERTAEALGIDYLGVDLLETDGRLVVNETNARPTVDAATKYKPDFYDRLAGLIERTAAGE